MVMLVVWAFGFPNPHDTQLIFILSIRCVPTEHKDEYKLSLYVVSS